MSKNFSLEDIARLGKTSSDRVDATKFENSKPGAGEGPLARPVRPFVTVADEERAKLEEAQKKLEEKNKREEAKKREETTLKAAMQKPGGIVKNNNGGLVTFGGQPSLSDPFRRTAAPAQSSAKSKEYVDIRAFKLEKKKKLLEGDNAGAKQQPEPVQEKKPVFDVNEYIKNKMQQRQNTVIQPVARPVVEPKVVAPTPVVKKAPKKKPTATKKKKLDADLVKKSKLSFFDNID